MTGIQYYVDSLLNALYALDAPYEIVAFAPSVWSPDIWVQASADGLFAWRGAPNSHVDTAGNDFLLERRLPTVLRRGGAALDRTLLRPWKGRTNAARTRTARRRYDLVHLPNPVHEDYTRLGARHSVVTIYDVTTLTCPWTHEPGSIGTWAQFFEYAKRCDRVLTISEYSKQDIVTHLGIPEDRVDVTPLAPRSATRRVTDPAVIGETRAALGLTETPFVLYSGTLEPRKNLGRLVEAFARAVAEGRLPEHRLVLAGGSRAGHGGELRARAVELGIEGRLVMPGYVSNDRMNALMSSCDAFAYVSEYEGFGMPPLEAMTCGAPVVASNTTSLPEVVGEAGLTVPPDDVEAIAGAMHRVLTDGVENSRLRALSLERARLFTWERTARLTLRSYEAAVA